jgi:hypothetical protein
VAGQQCAHARMAGEAALARCPPSRPHPREHHQPLQLHCLTSSVETAAPAGLGGTTLAHPSSSAAPPRLAPHHPPRPQWTAPPTPAWSTRQSSSRTTSGSSATPWRPGAARRPSQGAPTRVSPHHAAHSTLARSKRRTCLSRLQGQRPSRLSGALRRPFRRRPKRERLSVGL